MPQARPELRHLWGEDPSRAERLLKERFTITAGVIRPKAGVIPTEHEYSAIEYLCDEWDYAYEAPKEI